MKNTLLSIMIILSCGLITAQDMISNFSLRITPSFEHISVHVDMEGDDNQNSKFDLFYSKEDEMDFKESAPSARATNDMIVDGSVLNRNFHAASVMFLEPNTSYQLMISIVDPDGGSFTETISARTKKVAYPTAANFIRHVVPGDGGGDGGSSTPFLGLQAAANNANPGDVFLVGDGIYAPFELHTSGTETEPIVFLAGNLHAAIINGKNTDRGIITLGSFNDSLSHVIIDGFKIENGNWGIDAQNTQYVTVRNNKFLNISYGFVNRRDNGWEHNQYITNNEFIGMTQWPASGIPAERAIDLRGNNNSVSYNYIQNFGDGVSTDGPPYGSSYGLDIHNNDFSKIVDDFLEVDGMISNARVYSNRGFNGRMGVSLAPVLGGPAYVFRNVFFNMELSTFKMNRAPTGLVMVHNTGLKDGNATSSNAGWQNTMLLNNILCGSRYCFEEFGLVEGSIDQWDYNAYFSPRISGNEPWFKWNNIRYDNVADLYAESDIEQNGIEIDLSTFVNATLPISFDIEYNAEDLDLNLTPNSPCINSGIFIPNLNDPFVNDGFPDRGAIEFGSPEIQYGPDFDIINPINTLQKNGYSLKLSPNPVSELIDIECDSKYAFLQLSDLKGKILLTTHKNKIDLSSLASGVYILTALDDNRNFLAQGKFVKVEE